MKASELLPIFMFLVMMNGCATFENRDYRSQRSTRIEDRNIYVNGKPFAEIILIGKHLHYEQYRGICIHYLEKNTYEWITPRQGWRLLRDNTIVSDIPTLINIWKEPIQSTQVRKGKSRVSFESWIKLEWCGDARISPDAKYVIFKQAGLFGPFDKKYKIKYEQ